MRRCVFVGEDKKVEGDKRRKISDSNFSCSCIDVDGQLSVVCTPDRLASTRDGRQHAPTLVLVSVEIGGMGVLKETHPRDGDRGAYMPLRFSLERKVSSNFRWFREEEPSANPRVSA